MIAKGISPIDAAEVALVSPITDDRELQRSIREIITTIIWLSSRAKTKRKIIPLNFLYRLFFSAKSPAHSGETELFIDLKLRFKYKKFGITKR